MHEEQGGNGNVFKVVILVGLFCVAAFWVKRWVSGPSEAPPPPPRVKASAPPPVPTAAVPAEVKDALLGEKPKEEPKPAPVRRPKKVVVEEAPPEPVAEEPVGGGLSDDSFYAALDGWRGVKGCLAANPSRLEQPSGALKVSLRITADGEVVESRVFEESNDAARRISPCVERAAKKLRFPSFTGAVVVRDAKFVF